MKTWNSWATVIVSGLLIVASWLIPQQLAADVLMIAAAVVAGWNIAISAVQALRVKMISIDLLVVVAAVGALFIQNYWESAAVTFLFALGKALERATMARTRQALSDLVDAAPEQATIVRDGEPVTVELWEVVPGDTVLVKNGEQIPVDGHVISGHGGVDESTMTGESVPVEKVEDDQVLAGTWLRSGVLRIEAERIGANTTLASIIHRVEDAQDDKAKTQTFLEKFSQYYTPGVMIGALLVGLITGDVELALTLLVIACPGALVISIPVSIVAGIGRAARDGVLIKGGEYLETAARIDTVVVDKTGTLTHGKPVLTDVLALDNAYDQDEVLRLAASAETASEHPLAEAIVQGAREAEIDIEWVEQATPVTGHGIVAKVDEREVSVGDASLIEEVISPAHEGLVEDFNGKGKTAMYVGVDGQVVGIVAVADTVRTQAKEAVAALHKRGAEVIMATGDAPLVAKNVGAEVGVDQIHAGLLPEDKLELVEKLQNEGKKVAMIGDGVNDTPALVTADVGVAMGVAGSPAAIETADLALVADDLTRLPYALHLATRTVRTMRINIAIALLTVLILVLGVFFGGVTMSIGMLVHEASVLLVIVIAMLLLRPTLPSADGEKKASASFERDKAMA